MNDKSRTISCYRIQGELGKGGMGVVYRARNEETVQLVALKTVRAVHEEVVQSIRREIHALARMRHPGIVHIMDQGVDNGIPWYAMELLEGITLSHVMWDREELTEKVPSQGKLFDSNTFDVPVDIKEEDSSVTRYMKDSEANLSPPINPESATEVMIDDGEIGSNSISQSDRNYNLPIISGNKFLLDLKSVLTIFRRLCTALAFMHGEGMVHRDLKPDNVFLIEGNRPILVDFGLMAQFRGEQHRESLMIEGARKGTLQYIAPEQVRGEFVDARADLYALGCIIYKMIVGHPPFLGEPVKVIQGHLYKEATPISQLIPGIPDELEQLIARLMAKDPRKRLGYADTVAAMLTKLGAEDPDAAASPNPRAYHYRSGFVGRQEVKQLSRHFLHKLKNGVGALALVGGEGGVGKTRFIMELGREITRQDVFVLTGRNNVNGARPLEMFRQPLQSVADRCRARGVEETDLLFGLRGKVLATYEPSIEKLPGQSQYPDPVKLPADAAKLRLFSYLAETFSVLSKETKIMFALDDLQWADDLSLEFLEFVHQSGLIERSPILFVCTYRQEELGEHIAEIVNLPGNQRIDLDRLSEDAVEDMIGNMLAISPVPSDLSRHLNRHSEGNPLFIAEYLHTAIEEGLLDRDDLGNWQVAESSEVVNVKTDFASLPMPSSLQDLFNRRLSDLPVYSQNLAEAASVVGRQSDIGLLSAMTSMADNDILDGLDDLCRRHVFNRSDLEMSFVHEKIRELIYCELSAQKKQDLHLSAALEMEKLYTSKKDDILADLGKHWEMAGHTQKAKMYYLSAARLVQDRFAMADAERLYGAYLKLVSEPTEESVEIRNELGVVLREQGKNEEAIEEHQSAFQEAQTIGNWPAIAASFDNRGLVYWRTGKISRARAYFEMALSMYKEVFDYKSEAISLRHMAIINIIEGKMNKAGSLFHEALKIHRKVNDQISEAHTLGNMAIFYRDIGKMKEAETLFKESLTLSRQLNDRRIEGVLLSNFANLHYDQGNIENARDLFNKALEINQEVGDRRTEGVTLSNFSNLLKETGDLDEAQKLSERALIIHREVGSRQFESNTLINLAILNFFQGKVEETKKLLDQAMSNARTVGDKRAEGIILGWFATLARLVENDLKRAKELVQTAQNILLEANATLELAERYCEHGFICLAENTSAGQYLENARDLAQSLNAGPRSETGRLIHRLEKAQEAFNTDTGHNLFRGELLTELPRAFQIWLIHQGKSD